MTIAPGMPLIMSCRKVDFGPPDEDGAVRGHFCRTCRVEVEVSREGLAKLRKHGDAVILLCNYCTIEALELLGGRVTGPILNPAAQRGLERSEYARGMMERFNRAMGK
jgi:hypothetical protein